MNVKRKEMPNPSRMAHLLEPAMVEAGQALVAQIHRRALLGIGLDDAKMPDYADSTAKRKRKKGHETAFRTLTETGSMLRSMHVESISVGNQSATITIGFSNAEDGKKAAYNQSRTPWFGASPRDREVLQELLKGRIQQILEDTQ